MNEDDKNKSKENPIKEIKISIEKIDENKNKNPETPKISREVQTKEKEIKSPKKNNDEKKLEKKNDLEKKEEKSEKEKKENDKKPKEKKEEKEEKNENEEIKCTKIIGNYILFEQIGMGTFSKVTRATHLLTEQTVAVKILQKDRIEDEVDVERIIREIEILKNIHHPNIVQMYETYSTIHNIYLMMELVKGGDLFDYICSHTFLSEKKACNFFRQIISVIEYLSSIGISHRDIKPENILLDTEQKNIKIIDFGLSNYCKKNELLKSSCGSPCYASPEMLSGDPYYGITTDIWSSGIVLYSMLVGSLPFDDQELHKLYEQIKVGKFYLPSTLSMEAIDLLKKILVVDAKKRITLDEIKCHPWFKMENNVLYKGINSNLENFPCDIKVVKFVIKNYFNEDKDVSLNELVNMVKINACNKYTATYYLAKKYILCIPDKFKELIINKKETKNNENCIKNEIKIEITNKKCNEKNDDKKNDKNKKDSDELNFNYSDIKFEDKPSIIEFPDNSDNLDENENNEKKDHVNKKGENILNNNAIKEEKKEEKKTEDKILLTDKESIKKSDKSNKINNPNKMKENKKIEIPNLNLKKHLLKNNTNNKQKTTKDKKYYDSNPKKTNNQILINNFDFKSFTERVYQNGKFNRKEILTTTTCNTNIIHKNIIRKKNSPHSNNFDLQLINSILHRDKQEINNKKNSKKTNLKIFNKEIPFSQFKHERINTEIDKAPKKIEILENKEKDFKLNHLKTSTETDILQKNHNKAKSQKKVNIVQTKNSKQRKSNSYLNKIKHVDTNSNSNNYISNDCNVNFENNKNLIINIINNYNSNKKFKTKNNNTRFSKPKNDISLANKTAVVKNLMKQNKLKKGNSILLKHLSNTGNFNKIKKQTHQRNLSSTIKNQLTNFKTDTSILKSKVAKQSPIGISIDNPNGFSNSPKITKKGSVLLNFTKENKSGFVVNNNKSGTITNNSGFTKNNNKLVNPCLCKDKNVHVKEEKIEIKNENMRNSSKSGNKSHKKNSVI